MGVRARKDSLFFAIQPDAGAAARIEARCEQLRAAHGLRGEPIPADRHHVTLHFFDDALDVQAVVDKASDVARFVRAAPFEITFDRALSFNNRKPKLPFVLGCGGPSPELKSFQKDLSASLKQAGLPNKLGGFTPHLTLLYDAKQVRKEGIDPVSWVVNEFVLVQSFVGFGRHEVLGRWPLRGL